MHRTNPRPERRPTSDRPRLRLALGALGLFLVLLLTSVAPVAAAPKTPGEYDCEEDDKNKQCNDFGTISMDSRTDVRGKPVTVVTDIRLDTNYQDEGARWLLFSVRHTPEPGHDTSPVSINLKRFETPHGDIITTEVERSGPNEINLWVDVLDTPVDIPIQIEVEVGSSDRGAFSLETLVLPFDRGYEPIVDDGMEASLFAFTMLSVNKETRSTLSGEGKGLLDGHKTPGLAVPAVLLVAVAVAVLRRRNA